MEQVKKNIFKERDYQFLGIRIEKGVATISINNGPVNALSGKLIKELHQLMKDISKDTSIKVIVFESANPDFFIAHVDINILAEQEILEELGNNAPKGLNLFQAVGEMLRNQSQVTIVKLKGIARGGGAEFVTASDMSFASTEKGKLAQCEALMGIIPGGGATQYLSSKMTRGRILEVILGADLFDAVTAERYGWINRAVPDAEIDFFVKQLAQNIANLPKGVIETMKNLLPPEKISKGFIAENNGWEKLAFTPKVSEIMKNAMQNGAQTVTGELKLEELLRNSL